MLDRAHAQAGDVTIISGDLVAFADFGDGLQQLFKNVHLAGEGLDSNDGLERETQRLGVEIHGEGADDAALLEPAQALGDGG